MSFCSYVGEVLATLNIAGAEIVSGGCQGVDLLGERFAADNDLPVR